jgi:16S rRNA (guanine966-N2)-methyltransferase|tara:strand:- start:1074 stop:1643 length:570 start_codon:yes stop_codon:yes gene_type:complete
MKIIGGEFSGRVISSPKGKNTRPTGARVKESLFNFLTHGFDIDFRGLNVLDIFAGSGSLGIEALSRGAKFCNFIDIESQAILSISNNIKSLNLEKRSNVRRSDVTKIDKYVMNDQNPVDLIFSDPPYKDSFKTKIAIEDFSKKGWINKKAIIIAESSTRDEVENIEGFEIAKKKNVGDTQLCIYSSKKS